MPTEPHETNGPGCAACVAPVSPAHRSELTDIARRTVEALRAVGRTLATAESCTGGLIAESITRIPGASEVLGYGWVTYVNEAKERLLGVPHDLLEQHGAVSRETVTAMAEGARERSGADIAVAVSGLAGPGGGSDELPVGTVWLAWAVAGRPTETQKILRPMEREAFREMVAATVLEGVVERVKLL